MDSVHSDWRLQRHAETWPRRSHHLGPLFLDFNFILSLFTKMSASKRQDRHSYLHQDPFNNKKEKKTDWTCPLKQLGKKDKKILIKLKIKVSLYFMRLCQSV